MANQERVNQIRVNNRIRVPQVRVVGADGSMVGVLNTYEALALAKSAGLDLVEVNPKASPPICKILDYGKFKYEEKKKQNVARKNQKSSELKEITLRPKTEANDLAHKVSSALGFLEEGNKVKFTVRFRGREITHPENGRVKLQAIAQALSELSPNVGPIVLEGKHMSMIVSPK